MACAQSQTIIELKNRHVSEITTSFPFALLLWLFIILSYFVPFSLFGFLSRHHHRIVFVGAYILPRSIVDNQRDFHFMSNFVSLHRCHWPLATLTPRAINLNRFLIRMAHYILAQSFTVASIYQIKR